MAMSGVKAHTALGYNDKGLNFPPYSEDQVIEANADEIL
jgi:hypothetical protein